MLWNCCLWGANMGNLIVKVHMKSAQKIFEYEKLIQFWKKKEEIYLINGLQNCIFRGIRERSMIWNQDKGKLRPVLNIWGISSKNSPAWTMKLNFTMPKYTLCCQLSSQITDWYKNQIWFWTKKMTKKRKRRNWIKMTM